MLLLSLILILAGVLTVPAVGPHTYTIPHCRPIISSLTSENRSELRFNFQLMLQHERKFREAEEFKGALKDLAPGAKVPSAYKSSRSHEEWVVEAEAQRLLAVKYEQRVDEVISQLKASGVMVANATQQDVSACVMGSLDRRLYPDQPVISFLLNFYKRKHMIHPIVSALQQACAAAGVRGELVVNADEPSCSEEWANMAANTTGNFTVAAIFSPNLHEARGYNRAASIARAHVMVTLQDDDVPPPDGKWITDMLALFNKYPRLAIIGLQSQRPCRIGFNNQYRGSQMYEDKELGVFVNFAQVVDFGPLAVRRSAFEAVGGLDEGMSLPGTCGIFSDWELSTRMWSDGWQVMSLLTEGRRGDDSGLKSGTHTDETEEKCWGSQMSVGSRLYDTRWLHGEEEMCRIVQDLNNKHLVLRDKYECPWKDKVCTTDKQAPAQQPARR